MPFLFALGIAFYFALPVEPNIWFVLAFVEIWLLLFYICRHKQWHLFFIAVLIVCCGFVDIMLRTNYQSRRLETVYTKKFTYLQGRIIDILPNSSGKQRLVLSDAADFDMPLKGKFRITLNEKVTPFKIDQCVEMIATLFPRKPLPVLNGFQSDLDYFYKGLSATGYVNSEIFAIPCAQRRPENQQLTWLNKLRHKIVEHVASVLPASEAGIADALLIGSKSYIAADIVNNYRDSGLAHFLSVSGLHMGTIAGIVFFVIRFLLALFPSIALRFDIKKIAAVCAILCSAAYLLISGMAVPAQRAFIMTTVVFIGIIFQRQAISLRMVSCAAMIILIMAPQSLVSVSFQMSFAAVYALVAFYEVSAKHLRLPRQSGVLRTVLWYFLGVLICDFIASLATAPFGLYHFHRLALYTSLTNLLAAPIIAFWVMPAVLMCLLTLLSGWAYYPLKILGAGVALISKITAYVAALPHSVWFSNRIGFTAFILIVCGAYWLCIWRGRWRLWGILPIGLGVIYTLLPVQQPDFVFSVDAEQIAVRDTNGKLVYLPMKRDNWVKNIWQETLSIEVPDAQTKKDIKLAMQGLQKMPEKLQIDCDQNRCIYRDQVIFSSEGILLNNQPIDLSAGGYIYLDGKVSWLPLWQNHNRLWHQKIDLDAF